MRSLPAEPNWVFVGENGIFPGEQFLEAVAAGQISHDFMTSEVHDGRVYGDGAIVIARVHNRGEFEGNPFTFDEWSTDVFVRPVALLDHPPHLGRGYHRSP